MERAPNPEEVAIQYIERQARALLEKPQILYTCLQYRTQLAPDVSVVLRATAESVTDGGYESNSSRYIYVRNGELLCLSVDLNGFDEDDEEGIGNGRFVPQQLAEALEKSRGTNAELVAFICDAVGVQRGVLQPNAIEARYIQYMEAASLLTSRTAWRELGRDQRLVAISHTFEGDDVQQWQLEHGEPILKVEFEDGDFSTVLDIMADGTRETYNARSNMLEEFASVAPEDDISRGDDDTIIGATITNGSLEAVHAAERAAFGRPPVQLKHLKALMVALQRI